MQPSPTFAAVTRHVWGYYRRNPVWIGIVLLGIVTQAASETLSPWLIGQLVDQLGRGFEQAGAVRQAWLWLLFIGINGWVFWCMRQATHFAYDYHLKFPAMRDIGIDAFAKVQRFGADWHANSFAGAIVTKIKRGINASERFADNFYVHFIPLLLLMTGIIGLTAWRWPLIGFWFFMLCVAYAISGIWLVARFDAPLAKTAAECDTSLGAALADSVGCNATVKSFAAECREDAHFYAVIDRWRFAMWQHYKISNIVYLFQCLFMNAIKLALFGSVIWMWSENRATVGDIAFVITAYGLMSGYLRDIGYQLRNVQIAAKDLESVVEYAGEALQVADRANARPLRVTAGSIAFDQVDFGYENQTAPLFENFTLRIAPGEKIALVGHSGSGKSTLVKLLLRLYDTQSGSLTIDGQEIAEVTQASLRAQIALVPQEPILFHRTLSENIAYGAPHATPAMIEHAARQAHAHEFIDRLALKYDTLVGERGIKLSGGERQRVAIARAILADAPILVMDEATSSLDSESEAYIQDALDHVFAHRTVLVVAHRLSTIRRMDRIIVMDRGRIVEEGNHDGLVARENGVYRQFYERQAGGFLPD